MDKQVRKEPEPPTKGRVRHGQGAWKNGTWAGALDPDERPEMTNTKNDENTRDQPTPRPSK